MPLYNDPDMYRSRKKKGVTPGPELKKHIMRNRFSLHELFVADRDEHPDGEFLVNMRMVARQRIIGVFIHATDPRDNRGTDNYLVGAGSTLTDLVYYIANHMKGSGRFVRPDDLPPVYSELNHHWRDTVRAEARKMLLVEALSGSSEPDLHDSELGIDGLFTERHIWYDEGSGLWQARQSLIDEYQLLRRAIGQIVAPPPKTPIKDDRRTFHGRPNGQGRRRARENGNPGASIGGTR